MISRVGPRIFVADQMTGGQQERRAVVNHPLRGRLLTMELVSPKGHYMRASDAFPDRIGESYQSVEREIDILGARVDHYYAQMRAGLPAAEPKLEEFGRVITGFDVEGGRKADILCLDPKQTHSWVGDVLEVYTKHSGPVSEKADPTDIFFWQHHLATLFNFEFHLFESSNRLVPLGEISKTSTIGGRVQIFEPVAKPGESMRYQLTASGARSTDFMRRLGTNPEAGYLFLINNY